MEGKGQETLVEQRVEGLQVVVVCLDDISPLDLGMSGTTQRSAEAHGQYIDYGSVRWVLRRSQQVSNLRGVGELMCWNNGNARNVEAVAELVVPGKCTKLSLAPACGVRIFQSLLMKVRLGNVSLKRAIIMRNHCGSRGNRNIPSTPESLASA